MTTFVRNYLALLVEKTVKKTSAEKKLLSILKHLLTLSFGATFFLRVIFESISCLKFLLLENTLLKLVIKLPFFI